MGREADNDHGFRVQSLGFMDGRGTDATGAGHFKCHLNKKLNAPNFIVESSNTDVYTVINSMNEENLHAAFDLIDDILTKEKTSFRLVLPPESLKSNLAGFLKTSTKPSPFPNSQPSSKS